MSGELNVISLVLGFIAWILPIISLIRVQELSTSRWAVYLMISLCSCAVSLLAQIYQYYFMVRNEDISALIDTNGVAAFAATVLVIVTFILNVTNLIMYRHRTRSN
ncbi:hypothetical protein [Paenibacillus sp. YPG26]|uniref:hypothetical protein n=1 Tax=Paenibacillus sp. YPG26 TaxID=2878915 RepID=UPI0020426545|nr:hypothetical protein [Paenibacillus sp. YPG26]USB31679.1 hypothetical protein LDO05_09960 [Paenibacillus sp. YPG26]